MGNNDLKFKALRSLNLPLGHYAVTGSGPMGVRNLRELGDVDLIVSQVLWDELAMQHGVVTQDGVEKIVIAGKGIEAFKEGSFPTPKRKAPSVAERIAQAEIIDGLPFESLEHVIYYKREMGREKDLIDIQLIEDWLVKK